MKFFIALFKIIGAQMMPFKQICDYLNNACLYHIPKL